MSETASAKPAAIKALVVDDEEPLADLVAMALRYEGWEVKTAHTVAEALKAHKALQPDIAVLDIMLPDGDGLGLLKSLRSTDPTLPVLFLTAKDAVEDRVQGLTLGGDDYVTNPLASRNWSPACAVCCAAQVEHPRLNTRSSRSVTSLSMRTATRCFGVTRQSS